ncbi:MAG: phosphatase PAP2 family protein [Variovorax sp.]|nr:phosphatase PAP2 family protein [Variovorax sp.]
MNPIDLGITHFLNHYAGASHALDTLSIAWAYNNLIKASPILLAIFGLWFERGDTREMEERRLAIVALLAAACLAAATSVFLSRVLPARPRPLVNPDVAFVLPYGMDRSGWERASSMPSDHAAMYFALAGGLYFASRFWGVLALVYSALFICLPRAYLGLHFPSDLAAGATIGLAFAWLMQRDFMRSRVWQTVLHWEAAKPHIFYPPMLLLTIIIGGLFQDARAIVHMLTFTLPNG